jgi:hypothetical protein
MVAQLYDFRSYSYKHLLYDYWRTYLRRRSKYLKRARNINEAYFFSQRRFFKSLPPCNGTPEI